MRTLDPRLVQRTRSARPLLVADVALGVTTALAVLAQAALFARVVTQSVHGTAVSRLWPLITALAAAFLARGLCASGMEIAGRRAAWDVLSELRLALAEKRLRANAATSNRAGSAEVAAAAVQGIEGLEPYFARYLPQAVLACMVPPIVICGAALADLESALIMLITLPLVPVFMWLIGRYTEQRAIERWQALHMLSAHFLDVVRGLPTLRTFGRAEAQTGVLADVGERYRATTMQTLRVSFLSGSVLELAATLGVALVAVTAGVRLVDGSLGLQAGLTVLVLAPELYLPFRRLGAEFHASADGRTVAERMLDLLDADDRAPRGGRCHIPSPAHSLVVAEQLSFSYPARPGMVLDRANLELEPGETVALVGASGAGKSTMGALLLGLIAPTAGRISVGGVDLASCRLEQWRTQVAWVPQHPTLLRCSVGDNIRLGKPQASDREVRAAATLVGADDFITALPNGYQTLVGEGARLLSAGERRRIGLARAIVRDAPFLILDEPTADLDPWTVETIAHALDDIRTGRTVLLIAHRPELVGHADRIVRLVGGRIVPEKVGVAA